MIEDLTRIVTLLKGNDYQANNLGPIDSWLTPIEEYISNPTGNTEKLWRDLCNLFGVAAACNFPGSIPMVGNEPGSIPDDVFNQLETHINNLKKEIGIDKIP